MSAWSLQIFIPPVTAAAPPDATMAMCAAMLAGDWPRNYILFTLDSAAAQKQAAYGRKMADNSSQCRGFIFLSLFSLFAIVPSLRSKKSAQRTPRNLGPEVIGAEISCRPQRDQTASHWLFLIHQFPSMASVQSRKHNLCAEHFQCHGMPSYAMLQ